YEHLVLSDLVIVDEAHNFRSTDAKRTLVLRDLLRLQPRKEMRRRVLLLTATPINNSLDDLKQECSLLFCEGILLSENKTPEYYRLDSIKQITERCQKATQQKTGDITSYLVHGDSNAKFSISNVFRTDLQFGPRIPRISDYLKEQDNLLKDLQEQVRLRSTGQIQTSPGAIESDEAANRIAGELLDQIVVQRSRSLCKEIEKQQNSKIELLFRPDASTPEQLRYADEFDGTRDVLAKFLPLFEDPADPHSSSTSSTHPLSLKVYMWYDVSLGIKAASDPSSVVGLQRALVLKRLESSPVAFLITLLRLTVLHARRLYDLKAICLNTKRTDYLLELQSKLDSILSQIKPENLQKLLTLVGKHSSDKDSKDFLKAMGNQYEGESTVEEVDASGNIQLVLNFEELEAQEANTDARIKLERLWTLKEVLVRDFKTLLQVTPHLTDLILGNFDQKEWPQRIHAEKENVKWPQSPSWGKRIVSDAKLRRLVERLLIARRQKQKIIVFSQFTDSLVYIYSVLNACRKFTIEEFGTIVSHLNVHEVSSTEIIQLLKSIEIVTGATEDRDLVVNRFAPYYRIGPNPPKLTGLHTEESLKLLESWKSAWTDALQNPIEILFSSDVLAEGVNLQDTSVLINWDIHWNPVRMIQRTGRIDRRLNPLIETPQVWPELQELAQALKKSVPVYYWHQHKEQAPETVNMILPDELERELLLRERIATKTLAIDFTLGLEHGTGAEADWMEQYKYQGISSLNAWQKDRAIEKIASYHEKLNKYFAEVSLQTEWLNDLKGWFSEEGIRLDSPLIGNLREMGKSDGEKLNFSRFLTPYLENEEIHWLWTTENPGESVLNFWMILDGKTWPPKTRQDIPWHLNASRPLSAEHLLLSAVALVDQKLKFQELPLNSYAKKLRQGLTAFSAGFFADPASRKEVGFNKYFILQHRFSDKPGT
ncbi:MAG: DEAD/DEAH box helicase, partial [SAR324 cluster bacterium]|nr:DEAD/DEAH box helicase [SAR324 cluster bacterium]